MSGKTISEMAAEVFANNVEKGWRGPDAVVKTFGDVIALLHSEVSEALEAYRDFHGVESVYEHQEPCRYAVFFKGTKMPVAELHPDRCTCTPKPVGVDSEFADVLIRLLDDADLYGIDLDRAYEEKMAYNRTRSFRHGGKSL